VVCGEKFKARWSLQRLNNREAQFYSRHSAWSKQILRSFKLFIG
jgi:hypothetical protein